MPVIPVSGALPRLPWKSDSGSVVPRPEQEVTDSAGLIDLNGVIVALYRAAGFNVRRGKDGEPEIIPPPAPPGGPGTYPMSLMEQDYKTSSPTLLQAYEKLFGDISREGYTIHLRPKAEMLHPNDRKSWGYEYEDRIELAYDIPLEKRLDVLLHEYAAKRVKWRHASNPVNHEDVEQEIVEEAEKLGREYMLRTSRKFNPELN